MTKEQFIEKYSGKAVWCKTEELAKEFLKVVDSFGFKWYPEDKPTAYSNFEYYKNKTCYFLDEDFFMVSYLSLSFAKHNGYKIIEYKQEEKPKNLITLIAKELGVEIGEEFKIVEKPQENTYKLENDGLKCKFSFFDYSYSANLDELIIGEYTIKKLPQAPTLTDDEKAILRNLPKEFKWIVRYSNNDLFIYGEKPEKGIYKIQQILDSISIYKHLFQFIKWEDEEPHNIQELLEEYEEFSKK